MCSADLEVAIVLHEAGGVPELVAAVADPHDAAAWAAAEQAALLREAEGKGPPP